MWHIERNVDYGLSSATPAFITSPVRPALTIVHVGIPLVKSYRKYSSSERM
jgi:hypothetical protein